ncbi:Gfo/Idh/MocA family protein [Salinibacter ruber]|uniref:Gfo/Idh/MocA family protein n=1 Tax=Salinibacter ruber TaxID=146919 RepID=UPI0020734EB4|nr:Gfo/Idh/MocA family oxidoreductase [Salinibacter ruber]
MRSVVVGYGSIGRRHSRLLDELGCQVSVVSRRSIDHPNRYPTLRKVFEDSRPDYVVVANRTSEHAGTLEELAQLGFNGPVLVEKPLANTPISLPAGISEETFVAYNFRFHPLVNDLRDRIEGEKIVSVDAYAGEFLPNWRPDRDYRETYSAHPEQGGGVIRDLSHELDYLNWLLEGWSRVAALGGQLSELEISSDDVFILLLETGRCPAVTVHLNYLDREPHRTVRVNTTEHTLEADLIDGSLSIDGALVSEYDLERDATYQAEHEAILNEEYGRLCTAEEALDIMGLIDAAEESASNYAWVEK